MQHPMPEDYDEIATFITEGMHRLAAISMNDYGFHSSARMAQAYLERALYILESQQSFDRKVMHEIGKLKAVAAAIADEYTQLEKFCINCEKFNNLQTKGPVEWISKYVVRVISREYLGTVSHYLAYKIRDFHSSASSILIAV